MTDSERIGYLIAYPGFSGVCCQECLDAADKDTVKQPVSLYYVNVFPYRQSCHGCGKMLVHAATSSWPELFVKTSTFIDAVAATPTPPVEELQSPIQACLSCAAVGLPAHFRGGPGDDVTKTCPAYLAGRDRK